MIFRHCSSQWFPNGLSCDGSQAQGCCSLATGHTGILCREGRFVYAIDGQGIGNGTLSTTYCPSPQVLIGYSGVQICEGVTLLQVLLLCQSLFYSAGFPTPIQDH